MGYSSIQNLNCLPSLCHMAGAKSRQLNTVSLLSFYCHKSPAVPSREVLIEEDKCMNTMLHKIQKFPKPLFDKDFSWCDN